MNRNKRPASKQKVSEQLNTIVDNITRRGVYVVKKQPTGFCVQEYLSNKQILIDLPNAFIAQRLCDRYNQGYKLDRSQMHKLTTFTTQYQKNQSDMLFFEHILKNSRDSVTLATITFRYERTGGILNRLLEQIEKI